VAEGSHTSISASKILSKRFFSFAYVFFYLRACSVAEGSHTSIRILRHFDFASPAAERFRFSEQHSGLVSAIVVYLTESPAAASAVTQRLVSSIKV
jgi:hypothetical protein